MFMTNNTNVSIPAVKYQIAFQYSVTIPYQYNTFDQLVYLFINTSIYHTYTSLSPHFLIGTSFTFSSVVITFLLLQTAPVLPSSTR